MKQTKKSRQSAAFLVLKNLISTFKTINAQAVAKIFKFIILFYINPLTNNKFTDIINIGKKYEWNAEESNDSRYEYEKWEE